MKSEMNESDSRLIELDLIVLFEGSVGESISESNEARRQLRPYERIEVSFKGFSFRKGVVR